MYFIIDYHSIIVIVSISTYISIYTFKYTFFRILPLTLGILSGCNLCKGTLTFILLPLLIYVPSGETLNTIHHFKSLFTPNVQIRVTLSLLNCSLFMSSVQILITLSLSNCVLNTLEVQIFVILSLFNCDLVTLGVQILVTAPKICVYAIATGSATVNLSWAYSGFNSISLLFGTGYVDSSGSLSGSAFNQLKLVTLSIV